MKKLYIALLLLVLACFFFVGVWSLADRDPTESASENRQLAKFPRLTLSALLDGSFTKDLEAYYSDTFPAREGLLGINKQLNQFYYFSGSGEDSLLVLDHTGGAEQGGEALREPSVPDVAPDPIVDPEPVEPPVEEDPPVDPDSVEPPVEEEPPVDPEPVEEEEEESLTTMGAIIIQGDRAMEIPTASEDVILDYAAAINNLNTSLGDVRMISLLTPNSGQFYSREDFRTGIHDQSVMIDLCYGAMDEDVLTVDANAVLAQHTDEYIYFRTDHHWSALGAYYAYVAFCETVGFEAVPLEQFETGVYENFVGSMYTYTSSYSQSEVLKNNPDTLTYYLPVVETHAKYYADASLTDGFPVSVVYRGITEDTSNKYLCFLGGDHPAAVVETAVEDGPVCLVLKESYGNAFVPFLTSHYSKIIVIDPREFNRDGMPSLDLVAFAAEQGVDDVIVINYPFMINSAYYVKWLNRLVGIDME